MNVADLTCAEVNEAIHKLRPLDPPTVSLTLVKPEVAEFEGRTHYPPDYCHDWATCGPLLADIPGWFMDGSVGAALRVSVSWFGDGRAYHSETGRTPQEAIARAWLAWKTKESQP